MRKERLQPVSARVSTEDLFWIDELGGDDGLSAGVRRALALARQQHKELARRRATRGKKPK